MQRLAWNFDCELVSEWLDTERQTRARESEVSVSGNVGVTHEVFRGEGLLRTEQLAEDNIVYGVVASGPPVCPEDVETGAEAVEIVIMWGEQVLHVEYMSPPRAFYVGEADAKGKQGEVDFLVGSEALGADRMPIVVESGGSVSVVIAERTTCMVTVDGQDRSFDAFVADGLAQPCREVPGAQQVALPRGAVARVEHHGLTFLVRQVRAGKRVAAGAALEWRPLLYVGGAMVAVATFLLMFYFLPPYPASISFDLLRENSRLVEYLDEATETRREDEVDWLQNQNAEDQEGGTGERHRNEEGQMGAVAADRTRNRFGIEGPESNEDPHMAREEAREEARTAGIIGTLSQLTGSWNAPTSPFGRDTALGTDTESALGNLMGDAIGESFGFGGLGLRSTGRGGGGTGEGTVGLGRYGTLGHGAGGGPESGYGRGAGSLGGRRSRVPTITVPHPPVVRGSLSREAIRRVIRRHINEVRFCYEQGLRQRPDLEGRVTVAFIISPSGSVQSSAVASSTIGNVRVEGCATRAVQRWNFPAPDGGGIVVVNYPFMLTQSGG